MSFHCKLCNFEIPFSLVSRTEFIHSRLFYFKAQYSFECFFFFLDQLFNVITKCATITVQNLFFCQLCLRCPDLLYSPHCTANYRNERPLYSKDDPLTLNFSKHWMILYPGSLCHLDREYASDSVFKTYWKNPSVGDFHFDKASLSWPI